MTMEKPNINDFNEEKPCEYKGRQFLARDNGAILRLPKEGCRASKWDNVWTFGTKDERTGYMILSGVIRVHQVVCSAFHGPEPEPHMVVDHIDTNRCNNRTENLRWLTRLENALNNPATRKKIIYLCGSIQAFVENPTILRNKALPPNVSWMKTVTKEQAAACKKHMDRWAKEDSNPEFTGKGLGDWVFTDEEMNKAADWSGRSATSYRKLFAKQREEIEEMNRLEYEKQNGLKDSLTPGAKQFEWKTPAEFLLCPQEGEERTLQAYLNNLQPGKAFCHTQYGTSNVLEAGFNQQEDAIYVLTKGGNSMKPWALTKVTLKDGFFVHSNEGSFFQEDGGQKFFTLALGREWEGGEVFDELC